MREVALVFDREGKTIAWHDAGASGAAIPDSESLWHCIWSNRERIGGVAHTHPGNGPPWPSQTDLTTWRAIDLALGRKLRWWIVTETDACAWWHFRGRYVEFSGEGVALSIYLDDIEELRKRSYGG